MRGGPRLSGSPGRFKPKPPRDTSEGGQAAVAARADVPDLRIVGAARPAVGCHGWIVNLRSHIVEVMRAPDARAARCTQITVASPGTHLELAGLPGASVLVDDLLPAG